jgi:signal transduction histidine kinase
LEAESSVLHDLLGMAAHELLKPLALIHESATSIRERAGWCLEDESRRSVEAVLQACAHARIEVEALLLDGQQARNGNGHREAVDVATVVKDCIELLAPDIQARGAHLQVDPLPVVPGNAAMLTGVFGNLIANAVKHATDPGCAIQITVERSEESWVFGVESPGPAIPANERQRIFEPWRRGAGDGRPTVGAGLGLSLVRRLVERQGGEVGVSSPDGRRNRFYFTLPV